MAVEHWGDGGMTITGDDIDRYRWLAVKHALKLEVEHGIMMSRGSALPAAKGIVEGFGVKPDRTKVGVLQQLTELLKHVS